MKNLIPLLISFFLISCANVSTTKFVFKDVNGNSVSVEMPKEMEAKNLYVEIKAEKGIAIISADFIRTLNVETIKAQSNRESNAIESLSKGAAEGAMKGLIP